MRSHLSEGICPCCTLYGWVRWWAHQDLNLEPTDYESADSLISPQRPWNGTLHATEIPQVSLLKRLYRPLAEQLLGAFDEASVGAYGKTFGLQHDAVFSPAFEVDHQAAGTWGGRDHCT